MKRTIEQSVMSYAIKYNRLSELVAEQFNNNKYGSSDKINIFIDITKMCRSISSSISEGFSEDLYSIAASLLNLCAHYKSFFLRGYNVSSNIFLIHSNKKFNYNKKFIQEYSYYGLDIEDNNIVSGNLELLSIICDYIPNVYFIETDEEICVTIKDILLENGLAGIPTVLLTKDPYNFQAVYAIDEDAVSVFVPVKYKGSDTSYLVNAINIYERYYHTRQCKYDHHVSDGISPCLYGLLLSLTKVPERNIKALMGTNKALTFIRNRIEKFIIPNCYISPVPDAMTFDIFEGIMEGSVISGFEVRNRLFAIDVYNEYKTLKTSGLNRIPNIPLLNLIDPVGIERISNKYFHGDMVDFGTLMVQ